MLGCLLLLLCTWSGATDRRETVSRQQTSPYNITDIRSSMSYLSDKIIKCILWEVGETMVHVKERKEDTNPSAALAFQVGIPLVQDFLTIFFEKSLLRNPLVFSLCSYASFLGISPAASTGKEISARSAIAALCGYNICLS